MRVLHVLQEEGVPSEQFIAREIVALRDLGARVDVASLRDAACSWTPSSGRDAARQLFLARDLSLGRRLSYARWSPIASTLATKAKAARPDLVHAHFASAPAAVAEQIAARLRVPWGVSVHAHDIYAELPAWRRIADSASYVIACSEPAARDVRARIPEAAGRVFCVHHGLAPELWTHSGPHSQTAPPLVFAAGRFHEKKGFVHLLHACRILRDRCLDFHCRIAGTGPLERSLRRTIASSGLDGHVSLAGWLSQSDLQAALAEASAVVVPSVIAADGDRDNLPNIALEAAAAGVPLVVSRFGALEDIFGKAEAALMSGPGDGASIATALARLFEEPALAARLVSNGHQLVRDRFDPARNAGRLLEIFARAIERGVRTPSQPHTPTAMRCGSGRA